ncbi:MAG: hydroxyphenylacetyl-CoA thioesterase PaaI [Burkholderiaceae bacterium]|nr:hydroxyphenylacetyl-CoA thioesterase PaaI [Burkholderiaceae bacterium]
MNQTISHSLSPQQIADAVGTGMFANDRAAHGAGLHLATIGPGTATLTMRVVDNMLNGFAICHGGYITLLADTAFAYACNSYNALTVASSLGIDFIAAVQGGDVLTAVASEVNLAGRTGVYDVEVRNQHGARVAMFRGRSYRMTGKTVVDLPNVPNASLAA